MMTRLLFTLFFSLSCSVSFAQNLTFSFDDIQVNPADSTLSFAIMMSATVTGTYHIGGNAYVNYNAAAFGSNAVTNGRATVAGSPTGLTPAAYGNPPGIVDVFGGNTLNIDWSNLSGAFGAPAGYIEVPTTPDTLVRVTLKYIDPSQPLTISFDQGNTNGKTLWWDNVTFSPTPYNSPHTYGPSISVPATSLPVEWISFTADRLDSRNIQLRWETANEVNNDYFIVQRSIDGEFFEEIGTVDGKGTTDSPTSYSFLDNTYQANINYYRLKQMDLNGAFNFSNIVEVRFEGKEDFLAFHVFPSPVKDVLTIESLGKITEVYHVNIFDQMGRVVYEVTIDKNHPTRRINVSDLTEGIYNYEVIGGLEIKKTGRFLKI